MFGRKRLGLSLVTILRDDGFDYYVATDGNDSNDGLTPSSAWLTINYALNNAPSGSRVGIKAGTYAENSGANYLLINADFTERTYFIGYGGEVIVTDNGSTAFVFRPNGSVNAEFRNLTIQPSSEKTNSTVYFSNAVNDVRFVNCTIRGLATTAGRFAMSLQTLTSSCTIYMDNCTVEAKAGTTQALGGLRGTIGANATLDVDLVNCTFTTEGGKSVEFIQSSATNVTMNTNINGGTFTNSDIEVILIEGGTVAITGITASNDDDPTVQLGSNGTTSYVTTGSVRNSTITNAAGHALLIGDGVDVCAASGNTLSGGDYTLVCKECENVEVNDNVITGGSTASLYVKAGVDLNIHDNEISNGNSSAYAVQALYNDATANKFSNVTLVDNDITVTGSASIFNWGNTTTHDGGGSDVDRNAYDISGTSGNVGDVLTTSGITTLAGLRTAWDSYGDGTNDDNSTLAT